MKIAISLIATVFGVPSEQINPRRPSTKEDSRDLWDSDFSASKWSNLRRVVNHFNPAIDHQRQLEGYGCSCMNLFTYEAISGGAPVDEIDRSCKHLKECYKCAKQWHGEDCDPASKSYDIFARTGFLAVGNDVGGYEEHSGCKRALFECDQQYAKELISSLPFWDVDKTIFSGSWDPQGNPEQCSNGAAMPDRMLTASQMSENDLQMSQVANGGRPRPVEDDPTGAMTRPLMIGLWQNTRELIESKQESG